TRADRAARRGLHHLARSLRLRASTLQATLVVEIPTKAISLFSPWAWAIMHGGKDVENRSHGKRVFPQNVTGRVWVHASLWPQGKRPFADGSAPKKTLQRETEIMLETMWWSRGWTDEFYDVRNREMVMGLLQRTDRECAPCALSSIDALRGHIVGSVEVTGYRTPDDPPDSPWYSAGGLGIMLKDPRPLPVPVPAKGALGWWTVPNETLQAL